MVSVLYSGWNSPDLTPIQGGVEILLVASCYRNRDKLRPDGPLGLIADLLSVHTMYTFTCTTKNKGGQQNSQVFSFT